jgi:integrase
MASQAGRQKTRYPGVFFRYAKRIGGKGEEKVFYIVYRRNGQLLEEKAGREKANDMTPARASKIRADIIEGRRDPLRIEREAKKTEKLAVSNKWTIDRLWTEYAVKKEVTKAFKTDQGRYNLYIKETFGDKEPSTIIQLEVDRLRVKLLKKKSPQTVKHILALLKRIIKFGTDSGLCIGTGFAIKLPMVDNRKTEFLTPEEIRGLLEAIEADTHPQAGNIMKMALFTGMRRGEIFKLQWRDIDFQNGFISIREPKGGRSQKIPLNDGTRQVLEGIKREKESFVFPGNLGNQRSNINRAIRAIKTAAGLPKDFRPLHGLRHHFASMLASSGQVDLYTLQKLLTHKDHRMTERYAHLHDDVLKRASEVAGDIISQAANSDRKEKVADMNNRK